MIQSNRIRETRKAAGLTIDQLSEQVGLSTPYLSRIESSKRKLSTEHLAKIAKALGVSQGELLNDQLAAPAVKHVPKLTLIETPRVSEEYAAETRRMIDEALGSLKPEFADLREFQQELTRMRQVPLISWVRAGHLDLPATAEDIENAPKVSVADLGPGEWIALRVVGDSMNLISPDGSIIVVNCADTALAPNAYYVIGTRTGEASYKQYQSKPSRFVPCSTESAYESIRPDDNTRVIGRVRKSFMEM